MTDRAELTARLAPALLAAMLWACGSRPADPPEPTSGDAGDLLSAQAYELAQRTLLLDTHIDTPMLLQRRPRDLTRYGPGEFDYPKARQGGLDTAFMSIYVPASYQAGGARELADRLIDLVESWEQTWPDHFRIVRSPEEVEAAFGSGRIGLAMGIENGAAVETDLALLRHFRDRGVAYITLAHSRWNQICDSSYDPERRWGGLSPFGREVVAEMNRLGIMVDISHLSDQAAAQVIELSRTPVIASHSSSRRFTPGWERNLSDELVRELAGRGGVVQVNFGGPFLDEGYRKAAEPRHRELMVWLRQSGTPEGDPRVDAYRRELEQRYPLPALSVSAVADHIDHLVQIAGVDHVGFGSDFDGVDGELPQDLRDVSQYPNLLRELLRRGYSEEQIAKMASGNLLRVWRQVRAAAIE
jgi:membrane dipeptidase